MNETEMVMLTGSAIKALDDTGRVGGYLVRFGAEQATDLVGDFFTAETDFDVSEWPSKTAVYYNHGMDDSLKSRKLATGKMHADDVGVWVEAQLSLRDEYEKAIFKLTQEGKMGWSSGTAGHLVERTPVGSAKQITRWPLGLDASITPTPAEWRNSVHSLKSMIESDASFEALLPKGDAATSSARADDVGENAVHNVEQGDMPKEQEMETDTKAVADASAVDLGAVVAEVKALRDMLEKEPAVNAPALNLKTKLGDDETKALTHYIRTGDNSGLKASNANDMTIADATYAGNAVPVGHYQGIIAKRDPAMLADALGVMRVPGTGTTVNVPYDTGVANEFVATNETTAFDVDAPTVGIHQMTLVKYTKQIVLSYELLQDEDSNLMAFLNAWVGRALALTHNKLLVTALLAGGTSVALGAVTTAAAGDPQKLVYTLKQQYASGATFLMRGATFGALMGLTGSSFQYAETPAGGRAYSLWGYPVVRDENMEAVASGKKTIAFGDFSYMGLREAPSMEFLRDPYSKSGTGQIVLNYYFRAVYKVLLPEALLYGQQPTA